MTRQLLDLDSVGRTSRRVVFDDAPLRVETEDFVIDLESRTVWNAACDGVDLTAMQWRLVEFFVQNAGRVLTQTQLLHAGWGFRNDGDTEYVRIVVAQIREKLEPDVTRPRYFVTVPGEGFRFVIADQTVGRPSTTADAPDPVELLIDSFAGAIHPVQIEQRADLLRLLGDERAVPVLLGRLCESRVNDDPDVEDAVCGALVALGVMERLGNRRFRLRADEQQTPGARTAVAERRAIVPPRYWAEEPR